MKDGLVKLEPCPFCGGQASYDYDLLGQTGENHIACEVCGVLVCFDVDMPLDEVELAWNRVGRIETTTPDQVKRMLQHIRAMVEELRTIPGVEVK